VILSHAHWDHHGDPLDFPLSTFILGPGSLAVLEHGLPGRGSHSHFDPHLFSGVENVVELPEVGNKGEAWKEIGPFRTTMDIFDDGSVYVVDAPGHLPRHINILCRIG